MGKVLTAKERAKRNNRKWAIICVVIVIVYITFPIAVLGLLHCSVSQEKKTESDGVYLYHDIGNGYALAGEEAKLPETVYVPAYYKEKPIKALYYTVHGFGRSNIRGLSLHGVKKSYLPFGCSVQGIHEFCDVNLEELFIANREVDALIDYLSCITSEQEVYVYRDIFLHVSASATEDETNRKPAWVQAALRPANTAYMFNYEGAPNDGYFFINDFLYGEKIESTPYEPIRKGYTFGGWYKDSACTSAWNFANDVLPKAQYDEDGNEIFMETKLYAQWIKN